MTSRAGRVLLVLTSPGIAEPIHRKLAAGGRHITLAHDAATAQKRAAGQPTDLVIIDRESAGDDLELLSSLHDAQPRVPIIMLAAHPAGSDCLKCLNQGAIDYLPTSVSPEELSARVRAHLRVRLHDTPNDPVRLRVGEIELDRISRRLSRGNSTITLTPRETDILAYMMQHAGLVISRARLHRVIWGYDGDPGTNVVEVYVGYLRRKLGPPTPIKTVRGLGYRLAD